MGFAFGRWHFQCLVFVISVPLVLLCFNIINNIILPSKKKNRMGMGFQVEESII